MRRNDDFVAWHDAWLDTPFGPNVERVRKASCPDDLLDCCGICLKSIELSGDKHGFPKYHGVLVAYDETKDYAMVRGHHSAVSPPCVWTGTISQYRAMWRVD